MGTELQQRRESLLMFCMIAIGCMLGPNQHRGLTSPMEKDLEPNIPASPDDNTLPVHQISPIPELRSRVNTRGARATSLIRSGSHLRSPITTPRKVSPKPNHRHRQRHSLNKSEAFKNISGELGPGGEDRTMRRALAIEIGRALVASQQHSMQNYAQPNSSRSHDDIFPPGGVVRYRVVDRRGLALRTEPRIDARLDLRQTRERGVTWLTQGTLVWGGPPRHGWIKVHPSGYWLPVVLNGETQLCEVSPDPEVFSEQHSLDRYQPTSSPTGSQDGQLTKARNPETNIESTWLQRVRDTALSRWRARFGARDDPPVPRAVWVRHVPFGMSVRSGGLDVLSVRPGSNAHASGVRRGDRLVAVAGELVTPENWRSQFLSHSPPFTILLEPPPPRHPLLGALRAASPGLAAHRPRHAPLLVGFRRPERHPSYAARPLGLRSARLPSPSPEILEPERLPMPVQKKKAREKKVQTDSSEDETLQGQSLVSEVREAIKRLSVSIETAPNATAEVADPPGLEVTLLPHQRRALGWMLWREHQFPSGGILADEMGLGKTMMMISLIVRSLRRNPVDLAKMTPNERAQELAKRLSLFYEMYNATIADDPETVMAIAKEYAGREPQLNRRLMKAHNGSDLRSLKGPTLVVCPAILIHQWQEEMVTRCAPKLIDTYVYYGAQRTKDAKELARRDVVLTTYETLVRDILGANNSSKREDLASASPLLLVPWDRLVLDEAHMIKNTASRRARAVRSLKSRTRWAVTGTPLQNDLGELFSLMKFLGFSPFNYSQVWDACVRNSTRRAAILLRSVMLRRTKTMTDHNGKPLVHLPPRNFKVHRLRLSPVEHAIHDVLGNRSKALFSEYVRQRRIASKLSKPMPQSFSYANFLCALLRMRQACCHPALLRETLDPASIALALNGLRIDENAAQVSPPSFEAQGERGRGRDAQDNEDPDTTAEANPDERALAHAAAKAAKAKAAKSMTGEFTNFTSLADQTWASTKIDYTLRLLRDVRISRPGDKVVIVSQWTSMLRVLELHLQREGWRYVVIDGTVAQSHRKDIISDFNKNSAGAELMLLSMGAGGVGLNLIGGNHLILLDIHWNPAMEAQVCDRIYRVGQRKPCFVHKLLCEGTIEDRVQQLQDRKRRLFKAVVPEGSDGRGGALTSQKLTLEDMQSLFN